MAKKFFPDYTSLDPLQKITLGGIGSFLLMLILPKSVKLFIRYGFAGIAKNIVILVIAGLVSQKLANWIVEYDATSSERPTE